MSSSDPGRFTARLVRTVRRFFRVDGTERLTTPPSITFRPWAFLRALIGGIVLGAISAVATGVRGVFTAIERLFEFVTSSVTTLVQILVPTGVLEAGFAGPIDLITEAGLFGIVFAVLVVGVTAWVVGSGVSRIAG